MPLVRIALRAGVAAAEQQAIADAVHQALVDTIGIAPADRFQLISEHTVAQFILINLVEVAKENWSFGLGLAQYVPE